MIATLLVAGCSTAGSTWPPGPGATSPQPWASPPTNATPPQRVPGVTYVFPVIGPASYTHTHHDYPATDIIAACGLPVRAVTSGVVLAVSRTDQYDPDVNAGPTRGGLSVSVLGDDGVRYYGSHLSAIDPKISPGARVTAGQAMGRIGDTGDSGTCHLHFGISPPCARVGDWYNQRGLIWPWPYLDSWRAGGQKSPVAEVTAWQAAHGCPTKPLTDP